MCTDVVMITIVIIVSYCNVYTMSCINAASYIIRYSIIIINPRRTCAARVTVVVLSFCLSESDKTANKRYEWVQCHTGFIFKIALMKNCV